MNNIGEMALVTGAASGIGRAIAKRLAARGACVALLDSDGPGLTAVQGEIRSAGGEAHCFTVDVCNSGAVRDVAAATAEIGGGGLDTVVSCAGVLRTGTVIEMAEADWHSVISVNLTGTYLVAKHVIPLLLRRSGSFVAISSDAGTQGASGYAAYSASKHGVVGLIRCLALDHGHQGVRSNAICPSFVETPMADAAFSGVTAGERAYYEALVPLGRFARPEEIASIAAHLTSKEASYVNGMIYTVDGGARAGYLSRT